MAKLDPTKALGKRTPRKHPESERLQAALQEEETKQLKVRIPASLHTRFKLQATREQRDMQDIVAELLERYLENLGT